MSLESKLLRPDYRLWAAKSEGRQCIEQCIEHPPEPRSGLCPELLADFRIPNLLGARRGAEGSFLWSLSSRFSGGGGGVGSLPRAWRRVGVPGAAGAKKIVRLASVFPSPPFGLPTSQGRGGLGSMDSTLALGAFRIARDAGGEAVREREPRR